MVTMPTGLQSYDTWTQPVATNDPTKPTHHTLGHCPCCNTTKRSLWFKNGDLSLYYCDQCTVIYQDPQPDLSALLDRSYNKDYFSSCQLQVPTQSAAFAPRLALVEKILDRTASGPPLRV